MVIPSFPLLLSLCLGLAVLVSFDLPVRGRFPDYPAVVPDAAAYPRCLKLGYTPASEGRWNPYAVALHPETTHPYDQGTTWYGGVGYQSRYSRPVVWRPASLDSVDIVWHHSPVLRIPSRGHHVVGRGGWPWFGYWMDAMTSKDFSVSAMEVDCDSLAQIARERAGSAQDRPR